MARKQPPILHISSNSDTPYLCDAQRTESWPEKYLDDAVARTLEVCESCLDIYESNQGTEAKQRLLTRLSETSVPTTETDTESVSEPESSPKPSPITKVAVESMTLRQYLES
ncbi:MAG: hypothetical protein ACR2M9_04725 [Cyanophyceae cyanobacterium]